MNASIEDDDGDLVVTLGLKSMQKTFVFNSAEVPKDELEYDWSANFDIDGDGNDDYSVSLSHFKMGGGKKEETTLLKACQASLWALTEDGGEVLDLDVEARVDKDSIILRVPGYAEAFEFEKDSTVNFAAIYYLGGESYIP